MAKANGSTVKRNGKNSELKIPFQEKKNHFWNRLFFSILFTVEEHAKLKLGGGGDLFKKPDNLISLLRVLDTDL